MSLAFFLFDVPLVLCCYFACAGVLTVAGVLDSLLFAGAKLVKENVASPIAAKNKAKK